MITWIDWNRSTEHEGTTRLVQFLLFWKTLIEVSNPRNGVSSYLCWNSNRAIQKACNHRSKHKYAINFISSLKIKRKFWMEGHVWIENIRSNFLPNIISVKKLVYFYWFQRIVTSNLRCQMLHFQMHCKPCNLSFLKSPRLCHKGPWAMSYTCLKEDLCHPMLLRIRKITTCKLGL